MVHINNAGEKCVEDKLRQHVIIFLGSYLAWAAAVAHILLYFGSEKMVRKGGDMWMIPSHSQWNIKAEIILGLSRPHYMHSAC